MSDKDFLTYKLKSYNSLDVISKLDVVRDIRGNVIDLVYYNLLRGLKSSFKSECIKMGKDKVEDVTYNIIMGDYTLKIPLYKLNALRLTYSEGVECACMPLSIEPLNEEVYKDLDLCESVLESGMKCKDFMEVYGGDRLNGICMILFNKRKAKRYLEKKVTRLKKAIENYNNDKIIYEKKYEAYSKRIDANIQFLASISEDLGYLESKGYTVDIWL